MPELTQLLRVKSMMRYLPPNGTAGLARSRESTLSRSPCPPARIAAMGFRIPAAPSPLPAGSHAAHASTAARSIDRIEGAAVELTEIYTGPRGLDRQLDAPVHQRAHERVPGQQEGIGIRQLDRCRQGQPGLVRARRA